MTNRQKQKGKNVVLLHTLQINVNKYGSQKLDSYSLV